MTGAHCLDTSVHAVVAIMDRRWSDFLSARSHLTEAIFWAPLSVGLEPTSRGPTTYSSKWQDQSSELPGDHATCRPVKDGGIYGVYNGLLPRSDVHKLFDDGSWRRRPLPAARPPSLEVAGPATGSNSMCGHASNTRPRCPRTGSYGPSARP
jgi:hypothetical protein